VEFTDDDLTADNFKTILFPSPHLPISKAELKEMRISNPSLLEKLLNILVKLL
jgi:hypothetical protein